MSEVAKVRKASVSGEKFIQVFFAGEKAGKSNKEIAAELGMSLGTFTVRKSQLKKRVAEQCAATPGSVNPFDSLPARSRAKVDTLGMVNSVLEGLNKVDESAKSDETVTA